MRISSKAKKETHARILAAARSLFGESGFGATSTRDLATKAGIATGTLFNYFPTKEALAMTLVAEALDRAHETFERRRTGDEELSEELFAHVSTGLRALAPYRAFLPEVFEVALSPFRVDDATRIGDTVRGDHLKVVTALMNQHSTDGTQALLSAHLYWTLYLGVLAFWTKDESPNQEDTLVVLDQSMDLLVNSLANGQGAEHGER